jgi:hypothetical protein
MFNSQDLIKSYIILFENHHARYELIESYRNMPEEMIYKEDTFPKNKFLHLNEKINILHYVGFISVFNIDKDERSNSEKEFFDIINNSKLYMTQVKFIHNLIEEFFTHSYNKKYLEKREKMLKDHLDKVVKNKIISNTTVVNGMEKDFLINLSKHTEYDRLLERNIPYLAIVGETIEIFKWISGRNINLKLGKVYAFYLPEYNVTLIMSVVGSVRLGLSKELNLITIINNGRKKTVIKNVDELIVFGSLVIQGSGKPLLTTAVKKDHADIEHFYLDVKDDGALIVYDKTNSYENELMYK